MYMHTSLAYAVFGFACTHTFKKVVNCVLLKYSTKLEWIIISYRYEYNQFNPLIATVNNSNHGPDHVILAHS